MRVEDKTDELKTNIVDVINCHWYGISMQGLLVLMKSRGFEKESEVMDKVLGLIGTGSIRLGIEEVLRPGCDVNNKHKHLRNKIKVYKGRSTECGQWLVSTDVKGLIGFLIEDIKAFDLEYLDNKYDISYDIEVDWVDQDEFDNMGEFDGG